MEGMEIPMLVKPKAIRISPVVRRDVVVDREGARNPHLQDLPLSEHNDCRKIQKPIALSVEDAARKAEQGNLLDEPVHICA